MRVRTKPILFDDNHPASDAPARLVVPPANLAGRISRRLLHEFREVLPPTIFFFIGFNFVVFTSNLLVAHYLIAFGTFMLTTTAALIVGKAVLVANMMPLLRRYDRAPLILPILFKTLVYWAVVFVARLLEGFLHFWLIEHKPVGGFRFLSHLIASFSWHRFAAIQLWILVLFLIYVTASEFSHLFGRGEIPRLFFTYRPSELQLNRRQRIRELLRLSRLADAHSADEFRDPESAAHREVVEILLRLTPKSNART
jgi:hypothetical protein